MRRGAHRGGRRHHHRTPRRGPHRQVVARVAGVVEAARAVALHQPIRLALRRDVGVSVAGNDLVETTQVQGHRLGVAGVGGGAQHHAPAAGALVADPGQHAFVVGQRADVDAHPLGDAALEHGLARQQPDRHAQGLQWRHVQQAQRRLLQQVAAQERAVEVDHQRRLGRSLSHRRAPRVASERAGARLGADAQQRQRPQQQAEPQRGQARQQRHRHRGVGRRAGLRQLQCQRRLHHAQAGRHHAGRADQGGRCVDRHALRQRQRQRDHGHEVRKNQRLQPVGQQCRRREAGHPGRRPQPRPGGCRERCRGQPAARSAALLQRRQPPRPAPAAHRGPQQERQQQRQRRQPLQQHQPPARPGGGHNAQQRHADDVGQAVGEERRQAVGHAHAVAQQKGRAHGFTQLARRRGERQAGEVDAQFVTHGEAVAEAAHHPAPARPAHEVARRRHRRAHRQRDPAQPGGGRPRGLRPGPDHGADVDERPQTHEDRERAQGRCQLVHGRVQRAPSGARKVPSRWPK